MISKDKTTIQHGFKQITAANLLNYDDDPSYYSSLRGDKWLQACLKPSLTQNIPQEVSSLFETVRGAMIYSMFYVPLATLAAEQFFRVLEAGVRCRCKQLDLLKGSTSKHVPYATLVTKLCDAKIIPVEDLEEWEFMVFCRNRFSHGDPSTWDCQVALEKLVKTTKMLNQLFE